MNLFEIIEECVNTNINRVLNETSSNLLKIQKKSNKILASLYGYLIQKFDTKLTVRFSRKTRSIYVRKGGKQVRISDHKENTNINNEITEEYIYILQKIVLNKETKKYEYYDITSDEIKDYDIGKLNGRFIFDVEDIKNKKNDVQRSFKEYDNRKGYRLIDIRFKNINDIIIEILEKLGIYDTYKETYDKIRNDLNPKNGGNQTSFNNEYNNINAYEKDGKIIGKLLSPNIRFGGKSDLEIIRDAAFSEFISNNKDNNSEYIENKDYNLQFKTKLYQFIRRKYKGAEKLHYYSVKYIIFLLENNFVPNVNTTNQNIEKFLYMDIDSNNGRKRIEIPMPPIDGVKQSKIIDKENFNTEFSKLENSDFENKSISNSFDNNYFDKHNAEKYFNDRKKEFGKFIDNDKSKPFEDETVWDKADWGHDLDKSVG